MTVLRRLLVATLLLMLHCFATAADILPAPQPGTPATAPAPAKLVFANRTIFVFRSVLTGYPPEERADGARKRLDAALARNGAQQPGTRPIAEGTQVMLDGALLFLVTPADINPLAGDTTDSVASESAATLGKALLERREQASPRYLLIAAALCAAATLAYALILHGLRLMHRWVGKRSTQAISRRLGQVKLKNVRILDAEHYVAFMRQLVNLLIWGLRLMATYLWLAFVMGKIPYSRSWGERLQDYLIDVATSVAQGIIEALPGLVLVAVIAAIARLVMLTAGSVFQRVESGELQMAWLDRDTATPTRRILNVVIWLFALAMAYPYLPGAHTAAFQGVSVLVGLMVSIGASSIVGQGASGLILMYARSLRKGEYVRIGESEGTVVELGMFETRLRTGLGEEITMPNAWVLSNTTKNYSRAHAGTGFVLDTTVTIGYDTPWRQVHAMLELAAARIEDIAATPKPYVMQIGLSDFYPEYRLVAYATVETPRRRADVLNQLHQQIMDVFNEYGVAITSPHFTQEPATPHVIPKENWHPAPAVAPIDLAQDQPQ
ncbi:MULTISPECIES: mechanosensitive ion channel family protein [unclassified Duganella]|uniref:mechanosensitive ion channel family protein n=1 Tax=unclassified Duganella TaxID=2636909 RepID=UPI000E35730D|nr:MULTISPECIES: mechanosensitive ion channel domain-containing protein [unclassified Duganella]RFP16373.1 mechanosensitive ion channel protein MscS [Duganella sp. BJB475]RFP32466.1 mechanosensitive ion channel protein MscS [Duganella sp. BJB476]